MSHTFVSAKPPNSFRGGLARVWDDPDSRSTFVGVVGVILFYLLLWLLGPYLLRFENQGPTAQATAAARQFNIELAPETFVKPPPKPTPPDRFVETNPDAPENTPDKTRNFSDRNQQVAQEKPTPEGKNDRPATEGKKDLESTQIIDGRLTQPVELAPAVPENVTPPSEKPVEAVRAEQNPLPGVEKIEGENKQSFGSNVAKIPNVTQPAKEKVDGAKDVPLIQDATATQPAIDPQKPQPRPQLTMTQPRSRPAVLAENKFGTQNIGNIAVDARWSNYGVYLQKLLNVVQVRWEQILDNGVTYPPSGSSVSVRFVLNSEGNIAEIKEVQNHSSEQGAIAAVSAIKDRAPYGPWTDDMKAVLGEKTEMTFTFYYQ